MSVSNIGGHGVSDMLPQLSDASSAMPMSAFPVNVGNTTPQVIVDSTHQPNLSGVDL